MNGTLVIRQFGDPILRRKAREIAASRMMSDEIQTLIADMKHTLIKRELGVALAAPQVGKSLTLTVIAIRPLPHRPKVRPFDLGLINPKIVECGERRKDSWEGCISSGDGRAGLFAKVPRHSEITVRYHDETGKRRIRKFSGLKAQIVQHEVDHLNGVLFVDRVTNSKSYMTYQEYKRRVRKTT